MHITQAGVDATCSFYLQAGGQLPSSPQSSGPGAIVGPQLAVVTADYLQRGPNRVPFTTNTWNLTLPDPDSLHLTNIHVFPAGDARPTQHWVGDLHRI